MEISSNSPSPANKLSNFAHQPFTIRGIEVQSMEGLLQGLKFENPEIQRQVFTLWGSAAWKRGQHQNWKIDQTLYWQGKPIKRDSQEYQDLLDEAFLARFTQNDSARRALLATQNAVLKHSIGKRKPNETVLTKTEFTSRLTRIRAMLRAESGKKK